MWDIWAILLAIFDGLAIIIIAYNVITGKIIPWVRSCEVDRLNAEAAALERDSKLRIDKANAQVRLDRAKQENQQLTVRSTQDTSDMGRLRKYIGLN